MIECNKSGKHSKCLFTGIEEKKRTKQKKMNTVYLANFDGKSSTLQS